MPVPAFLYDDAYITLASAQAVWLGHDPHFPGTPPLYGVTSPVHCLLVAALLALLPPLWALLASCLLGAAAYAAGLWHLSRLEGLSRVESVALVAAGMGAGMISQHLVNGLETSWALATVTWMLWAARRGDHPRLLGVLAGTAPFVRPELAVVALALLAWQGIRSPGESKRVAIAAVVAALPWVVLLWSATGQVVPTTLHAKRAWYAEGCWPGSQRAMVVATGVSGWLSAMPVVAFGAVGLLRSPLGRIVLSTPVFVLAVWALSVPNVLHAYQRHRYYAAFLPLLLYGLARLPKWARMPAVVAAALMALASTIATVRLEPLAIARADDVRRRVNAGLARAGAGRVFLHDAGYLAFSGAMAEGVDMVGLKTPRAAQLHREVTEPSCGARRGDALVALAGETSPSMLVIWGPWDEHFGVTSALQVAGWTVRLMETVDSIEPVFVYALEPPGPR